MRLSIDALPTRFWIVVFALLAATLGLAAWGVHALAARDPVFLGDTLRRVLELVSFTLPLELAESIPTSVRLARVGVIATIAIVALNLTLTLLRPRLRARRAARLKGHVVVCTGASCPAQVAADAARDGIAVVHLEPEAQRTPEHPNVLAVAGEATQHWGLKAASVARARAVLVLGASDMRNLAVASTVESHAETARPQSLEPLRIVVEINDESLRHGLSRALQIGPGRRWVERRFFFKDRAIARLLLQRHPLDRCADVSGKQRLGVLILHSSGIGEQLLREILCTSVHEELVPRVILLDRNAALRERALRSRFPFLDRLVSLECREYEEVGLADEFATLLDQDGAESFTSIYLCADQCEASLRALGSLQSVVRDQGITLPAVYFHAGSDLELTMQMARDMKGPQSPLVVPFGAERELYSLDNLIEERLDTVAQAVHAVYLDEADRHEERVQSPAVVPWHELPETYRDACRRQADHIEVKLRRIQCSSAAGDVGAPFEFTPDEIEILARLEHRRWMADRYLAGWTHGDVRDDRRLRHPALVPYDDLPQSLKDLDRSAVWSLPAILAGAGRTIRRDLHVGVVGNANPARTDASFTLLLRAAFDDLEHESGGRRLVLLSPLLDGGSRWAAQEALSRELAVLRAVFHLPLQAILDSLGDTSKEQELIHLLDKSEQVFSLRENSGKEKAVRVRQTVGRDQELRLAAWLGARSHRFLVFQDEDRQDTLLEGVLAAARRGKVKTTVLLCHSNTDWKMAVLD